MLHFEALASSSAGCCYLLRCGSQPPLLIDAGISFAAIQQAMKFRVSTLAGGIISHAHGDHIKAVPQLLAAGVDLYASPETWSARGIFGHRARTIRDQEEFSIGPWRVLPFEAVHDMPGTFGFVIQSPEGDRLLYLTDTAYSKFRFEGLTHIAVEANHSREQMRTNALTGVIGTQRYTRTTATHMSLERLIDMLAANDLSKVEAIWLLHLSDENSDEAAFKLAVQKATGKPVYVAAK